MWTTAASRRAPVPRTLARARAAAVLPPVATVGLLATAVLVALASWWAIAALALSVAAGVAADRP